jgi:hypothetical protein
LKRSSTTQRTLRGHEELQLASTGKVAEALAHIADLLKIALRIGKERRIGADAITVHEKDAPPIGCSLKAALRPMPPFEELGLADKHFAVTLLSHAPDGAIDGHGTHADGSAETAKPRCTHGPFELRCSTHSLGTACFNMYPQRTVLEAERNASLCGFGCDTGGTASQPSQPNGNLLLLGSFRGSPEIRLGLFVFWAQMSLEQQLKERLLNECAKLIERHQAYQNHQHIDWLRNRDRIAGAPPKEIKVPEYWDLDPKFNPFYVRSNAAAIARSIARKIAAHTYVPFGPHRKKIPKPGGGERELTVFQIPDAAVSSFFYARLLAKNRHRFSSFSYAYRNDRNVHFAIQDIAVDLAQNARTFIAEFDFSDFFGSIDHGFLFAQLHENGFLVSAEDEEVIRAFLHDRERGIPQGTSLSLFLANLVCWKLDKSLEKAGLKFARYADDTVIWSPSYTAICESFNIVDAFSREAKVPINLKKSDGISLLAKDGLAAEIASKPSFNFLGYAIGVERVSVRDRTVLRIKKQVSYLLYRNLIQPLKSKPLKGLIIPANDRDKALLTAMMQIRRYLYGGLLHRDLVDYIKGRRKSLHFKGVMSFYPLLNDVEQLRALDGWLISTIDRAVQARSKQLLSHGFDRRHSFPFNVDRQELLGKYRRKRVYGKRLLEVPSFQLIYRALQRGVVETGIERVMHPESSKYGYGDK